MEHPEGPGPIRSTGLRLLDALPVGVAMFEPVPPFRCVYRNPVFACWAWCRTDPDRGTAIADLLGGAVSAPAGVLARAIRSGSPQLLIARPQPLAAEVPIALVTVIRNMAEPNPPASLVLTTLSDTAEHLGLGLAAGVLPGVADQLHGLSLPAAGPLTGMRIVEDDGLTLDLERQTVTRDGRRHRLTWTEWQLFWSFVRHPGITLTRRLLAELAWGDDSDARTGEVEVYISRVRRKVEADPRRPRLLLTVHGAGYRLLTPPAGES